MTVSDLAFPPLRNTASAEVSPGAASGLRFETQPPASGVAGQALAPVPTVAVVDAFGNRTPSGATVTLSLGANPASATLAGTLSVAASSGLAGFSVWMNRAGSGYRLVASSPGLASAASETFSVVGGAAAGLVVAAQPSVVTAGEPFAPALVVQPVDSYGNPASISTDVRLSIGSSPADALVHGTTWASTGGGAATFDGAWLDRAGSYTLVASAPSLGAVTTSGISVSAAAPSRARFVVPPSAGRGGMALDPPPAAALEDPFGNACDTAASPALSVHLVGGSDAGTLLGETSAVPVNGVATFPRLALDGPGRFSLFVGGDGLGGDTSEPFEVATGPVARFILSGPARAPVGEEVAIEAIATDAAGTVQPGYLGTATLVGSDPPAEAPGQAISFPGGQSGPIHVTFKTRGTQSVSLRENGGRRRGGNPHRAGGRRRIVRRLVGRRLRQRRRRLGRRRPAGAACPAARPAGAQIPPAGARMSAQGSPRSAAGVKTR